MPIYEYECLTCGTTFEKRQSFSEPPVADCPNGHPDTRRLLSAPAIVFKGSGFYITDSKTGKNGANAKSSSSSSDKTETKTDSSSSETKKTDKTKSSSEN